MSLTPITFQFDYSTKKIIATFKDQDNAIHVSYLSFAEFNSVFHEIRDLKNHLDGIEKYQTLDILKKVSNQAFKKNKQKKD